MPLFSSTPPLICIKSQVPSRTCRNLHNVVLFHLLLHLLSFSPPFTLLQLNSHSCSSPSSMFLLKGLALAINDAQNKPSPQLQPAILHILLSVSQCDLLREILLKIPNIIVPFHLLYNPLTALCFSYCIVLCEFTLHVCLLSVFPHENGDFVFFFRA